jgi:ribosome-binding factor A
MSSNTGEPSQRQLRVGEQLRQVIIETLHKGKFNDILLMDAAHNVTVSEVRPSPDLKYAKAYIYTLGGKNMDEMIEVLNESASTFQKEIGKKLSMKFTPRIKFVKDTSFDEANKIDSILKNL